MKYSRTATFRKLYRELPASRRQRVDHAIRKLATAMETGAVPGGLGLKQLRDGFWEVRAGLFDRAVFHRSGQMITFTVVGTHDDVKRFLKKI